MVYARFCGSTWARFAYAANPTTGSSQGVALVSSFKITIEPYRRDLKIDIRSGGVEYGPPTTRIGLPHYR